MSLSIEQRKQMIRDAGEPKKGHHWMLQRFDREGVDYRPVELKTQFKSEDGKLVAHRIDKDSYTILDLDTSYIVARVRGRKEAKAFIEELGSEWNVLVDLLFKGDDRTIKRVREVCRRYA
jgi:hypothetical protein